MNKIRLILALGCSLVAIYVLSDHGFQIPSLITLYGISFLVGVLFPYVMEYVSQRKNLPSHYEPRLEIIEFTAVTGVILGFLNLKKSYYCWTIPLGTLSGYIAVQEFLLYCETLYVWGCAKRIQWLTQRQKVFTLAHIGNILHEEFEPSLQKQLKKFIFEKNIWKARNHYPELDELMIDFFIATAKFWRERKKIQRGQEKVWKIKDRYQQSMEQRYIDELIYNYRSEWETSPFE